MIPLLQNFRTIIVANGAFPQHPIPLSYLYSAERIICCDGAISNLLQIAIEPDYIVGDLDSISEANKKRFATILYPNPDQETNDLTKAIQFCKAKGWQQVTILGATGKREDHTIGNLSLLLDYSEEMEVQLLTDYGVFNPQTRSAVYESYQGQQVSIFSLTPSTLFSSENLRYPLHERRFDSWWKGTLNEALLDSFTLALSAGKALIFREYKK